MVITDINNTKIRVENEDHSKAIYKALTGLGFYFKGNHSFISCITHYFVEKTGYLTYQNDGDDEFFHNCGGDLIFFYNGEFHDKPQDDNKVSVSEILELADEAIIYGNKAAHKLIEIGYEYHNGEWLSKEELEKKKEVEFIKQVSDMLNTKGFGHDKLMLKCLLSHGYLMDTKTGYRKGEL